jgi:hypothetical protein
MQIRGERGRVGGQSDHGVNVDAKNGREGKGWRPKRAWSKR